MAQGYNTLASFIDQLSGHKNSPQQEYSTYKGGELGTSAQTGYNMASYASFGRSEEKGFNYESFQQKISKSNHYAPRDRTP